MSSALSKHQYEQLVDLTAQPLILMVPYFWVDFDSQGLINN